jgi:hypothetical protein
MFSVFTDFDRVQVERFKQATEQKLRDVRCPEHHQAPRLRFQGTSLRNVSISLSGCCPKVMELANAKIGSWPEPRQDASVSASQYPAHTLAKDF